MSNILKGLLTEANSVYGFTDPDKEYGAPYQSRPRIKPQEPEDVPDDLPIQDPFKQDPAKLAKVEYSKDEGEAPNGKRYNMVMSVSGPSNAVRNEVEMFNKHHWGAKKIVDMKTIEAKTPNGPAQYTVYIVDNHKYGMWTPFKGEKPVGEPLVFKESQDGISASDLADILYNRLEMRYPDIVTRYGHEVVGDAVMDVADFHAGSEELGTSDVSIMIRQILKKLENYNVDESKEVDYDDPKWDAMVKRVGQLAKQGPRKTVYDPVKRVYKTVPVNPPKDKGVAEEWSQKYKKSINCSHPKGFSQKAHCAGKKKHNESIEMEMTCPDCGMCQTHGDHSRNTLDEACWKGYHKEGNKKMFGKTYPNCVKNEDVMEMDKSQTPPGRDGSNDSDAGKKEYTAKPTTPKKVAKHGEKILNKVFNKKQGVAEGSEWETRHDEFTTVGDRATPEQINKIVSALGVAAKQASSKRGFLNKIVGRQSNGDLARMAQGAETLAKNIQRNSNAKPGTDERKELGQHLVYAVSLLKRIKGEQGVAEEKCPHCSGPMFSELMINEKKDACYYKVKSRYKVWPSAYASGALVKCRKKGASNWGTGGKSNESIEDLDENLHKWFKEKWVRFGPDGKIRGACARGDDSEGKPKCLPQSKAHNLGKKGRASAAARKRREDPNPERSGKAINVNTKKKSNEGVAEGLNEFASGGDDGDRYLPPNFGKPYKSRYLRNNQFDIWCETVPDTPAKDIQLKVTVDKSGLDWDGRYWYIDSPGGVHLKWKYGEIPLPGALDQAGNPGHVHDLISDFLNKYRLGDLQDVAKYYGFSSDGKMNMNSSQQGVAEEFELAGVGVAYELGRKAYKQGMTIRDNPYSATKEARKYDEWEKGLERGKWDAIEARKFRNNIKETKSNILKGLMR
jgi:hypothetical protein